MSDSQKQFEIDLDEIERQLRRSVNMPPEGSPPPSPEPKGDPLVELARIVGQNDPFAGILGDGKVPSAGPPPELPSPTAGGSVSGRVEPVLPMMAPVELNAEERGILGRPEADVTTRADAAPPYFDPVVDAYGSAANAVESDEFQPLPPRASRRKLVAVMALLAVAVGGAAGAIAWRNGRTFTTSGPPPLIKADNAPLKVAPQNPGGMEIPNQDRQIYERPTAEAGSRVLDRQEQPIDVRAATRNMPQPESSRVTSAPSGSAAAPSPAISAASSATPPSAVASALGEPRRVRTVAVRPDGTTIFPSGTGSPAPDTTPMIMPGGPPPPPVSVATMSIPAATGGVSASSAAVPIGDGAPNGPAISVLPPPRPGTESRQVAALQPTEVPAAPAATDDSVPNQSGAIQIRPPARPGRAVLAATAATEDATASSRTYAVQIATRPTDEEAQAASTELSRRYAADIGSRPVAVVPAQVNGKAVFRVRVGPLSRDDANGLCTQLKAAGGACYVAAN